MSSNFVSNSSGPGESGPNTNNSCNRSYKSIKNLAIVAHVDHGKTTLLDGLLFQTGMVGHSDQNQERIMDSMDLERERGITIMAKNCSIFWKDTKINILDTPGHVDFGGEVERSLSMVDGVLLLVDAAEGPLPQTRFVLMKAMERRLKAAVIINKIDRSDQRAMQVKKEVEDLFLELATYLNIHDVELDIPFFYAWAKKRKAFIDFPTSLTSKEAEEASLKPLLDFIVSSFFPEPKVEEGKDLRMLISNLSYSPYFGPLMIGKITRGSIKRLQNYICYGVNGPSVPFKASAIRLFDGLLQKDCTDEEVRAGEIVIVAGFETPKIGDTICSLEKLEPLPRLIVDPPTVSVQVSVNTSPFSGKEGSYLTSRELEEYLAEVTKINVALQYERTSDPKIFTLKGRGELQLAIVFEELRRKGYEFMVSRPEVLLKDGDSGEKLAPFEKLVLDIPTWAVGVVSDKLSKRKGKMTNMMTFSEGRTRMEFTIPTRGLIGYRSIFLTDTKGEGLMSSYFYDYFEDSGNFLTRIQGALIADRQGRATPYALFNLLPVGRQFIIPGEDVYEGMVIGEGTRTNDINVNVCREKHLSNVRTAGKDENIILPPIPPRTLDFALSWIESDEWVEVTPKNIRIRKKILIRNQRSVIRG